MPLVPGRVIVSSVVWVTFFTPVTIVGLGIASLGLTAKIEYSLVLFMLILADTVVSIVTSARPASTA